MWQADETVHTVAEIPKGIAAQPHRRMAIDLQKPGDTAAVIVMSVGKKSMIHPGEINAQLHEYSDFIIGRMGLPYRERNMNIITIAIDAPQDVINALSGKLGRIPGVTAKAVTSKEQA